MITYWNFGSCDGVVSFSYGSCVGLDRVVGF